MQSFQGTMQLILIKKLMRRTGADSALGRVCSSRSPRPCAAFLRSARSTSESKLCEPISAGFLAEWRNL